MCWCYNPFVAGTYIYAVMLVTMSYIPRATAAILGAGTHSTVQYGALYILID